MFGVGRGTYYSVRKEEKWLVHCKIGRRRETYDLIVDMIAIYQLRINWR
jgi:hypothetical protein